MLRLYGLMQITDPAVLRTDPATTARLKVDVYLRNAATLAASAKVAGMPFALVGSADDWLRARFAAIGLAGAVEVIGRDFPREVPEGIPFQAAHFKLDLLAAFATGDLGDEVALVDLDMVIQRPFTLPDPDPLYAYDIWDHTVPFRDRIRIDLDKFDVPANTSHWYGGEFIAGSPARFAELSAEIEVIWPSYVAGLGSYHHTGDEMVVTSALLRLAARGMPVRDAGELGFVNRWWSSRTKMRMPPLDHSFDAAMMHFPADKNFRAVRAGAPFDPASFPSAYRRNARLRRCLCMAKNVAEVLRGREALYLPHIT